MTSVSSTSSTTSTTSTTSSTSSVTSYASSDVTNIDWTAIIEAAYEAKLARADTLETKITTNETKISAYEDAESLLTTLQTAAEALRAPTGTLDSSSDVFLERTAYLTGVGGADASSTVSVSATSDADTGSYSLTVSQLATAQKVGSGTYSSSSSDLNLSGSVTLGTEGGSTATIDITSTMSLTEIAAAINDQTDTTGVKATVLKVSDSEYQLIMSTKDTGKTISVTDGDGVFKSLGILNSSGDFADEIQKSQNAIFTLDGVTITRSSNDVSDVLNGVTLYLYQTTGDNESVTVEVEQNYSNIKSAITTFIDAYNAYRKWAMTQQETTTSGSASSDAVLFGDGTIRNINSNIADALNFSINSTALATLGITFDSNNELSYDEDTLDSALLSSSDAIEKLFAYSFDSSSNDLRLLSRGTSAPSTFTIDVTVDSSGNITGASIDGDSSMFTISGTSINGVAGTAYEGYSFYYGGTTSQSVTITQSSGIAEQLYNVIDGATNSDDGSLTTVIDSLTSTNDKYQNQIDDITSRAETYKTNLTTRYANIQAKISVAQSTLSYLQALLDAQNSSSSG